MPGTLGFRELGQMAYEPVWQAMQRFTNERGTTAPDEIWLVEHPPVFTQGQAGKPNTCCCRAISRWYRSIAAGR